MYSTDLIGRPFLNQTVESFNLIGRPVLNHNSRLKRLPATTETLIHHIRNRIAAAKQDHLNVNPYRRP